MVAIATAIAVIYKVHKRVKKMEKRLKRIEDMIKLSSGMDFDDDQGGSQR